MTGNKCDCGKCHCGGNGQGCNDVSVDKKEYNCGADRQVIKHQHIVKYRHDIINEYDVIYEHEYNIYDVVKNSQVVKRNDYTSYKPKYCGEGKNCGNAE